MKTRIRSISRIGSISLCAAIVCACNSSDSPSPPTSSSSSSTAAVEPRNVILIIGDGMDDQQITAARNYLYGASGQLNIDQFSKRSAAQVLTLDETTHDVTYVADSANGGTTLASGAITSAGRIGTTVDDVDAENILELAKAAGYKAGVVTSASVTDATPADFLAHVSFRGCEGPVDMDPSSPAPGINLPGCVQDKKAMGGMGSIAEQIATGSADVVLGGGTTKFGQTIEEGGKTVLQLAQEQGFQYVSTPAELSAATGARVLGLFASSTLPVKLTGPAATKMTFDSTGAATTALPTPGTCTGNGAFAAVPSLAAMTDKAIELLSSNNQKGFFLMVESASVDKRAHSRDACGHIGEMEQLDEVAELARAYAADHPNTLVIVTADHGHSVQVLNESSFAGSGSVPMGYVTRLTTPSDGSILRIGYATSNGGQEEHTGTQVPVMVYGGLSTLSLKSFMQQSEVFSLMAEQLSININ